MDPEGPKGPPPAFHPPLPPPPPGIEIDDENGPTTMDDLLIRSITPVAASDRSASPNSGGTLEGSYSPTARSPGLAGERGSSSIFLQPPPPVLAVESATDTDGEKEQEKQSPRPILATTEKIPAQPPRGIRKKKGATRGGSEGTEDELDEELGGSGPLDRIQSFLPERDGPVGWREAVRAELENYAPGFALAVVAGLTSLSSALFMLDPSDDSAGLKKMVLSRLVAFFIWVSPPLHFGVVQLLRLWVGSYQLGVIFLTIFWDIFVLVYNLLTAFGLPGNYIVVLIGVVGTGTIYYHSFVNFSEEHPEAARLDESKRLTRCKAISVGLKLLLAHVAISCSILLGTRLVWAGELNPLQVLFLTVGVLPGLCHFFAAMSYFILKDLHKAGCQNLWALEAWIMSTVVLLLRTLSTDRTNPSLLIGFIVLSGLREVLFGLSFRWKTQLIYMLLRRKFSVKQLTAIDKDEILRQMHKQWYERGRGSVQKVRDVTEVAGTIAYGFMVAMRERFGGSSWTEACVLAAWLIVVQLVVGLLVDVTLTHYLSKWWGLRPLRLRTNPFPPAVWLLVGGNLMCQAVFNHGIWYGPDRPSML